MAADFHTHKVHPGKLELVSAPARPEGAAYWSLEAHPWKAGKIPTGFEALVSEACAVGEIGFDRYRGCLPYPAEQLKLFGALASIAAAHRKPVVIHAVGSFELLFEAARNFRKGNFWMVHGFAKHNPALLESLLKQDFFVSLAPSLGEDEAILQTAEKCRFRHIGLESDNGGQEIDELYTRCGFPEFAALSEETFREFLS